LEGLQADAQHALERGDFDIALAKCDEGLRASKRSDPGLAYNFLLLKAEVFIWHHQRDKVADLLAPAPPALDAEFQLRRKILLGNGILPKDALKAKALLDEAQAMIANASPRVRSELALSYGTLYEHLKNATAVERSKNDDNAEKSYNKALEFARESKDSFAEAVALADLAWLLTKTGRYDQSLAMAQKALQLAQAHDYRYLHAGILLNLGWNYQELGDFYKSLDAFKRMESFSADTQLKEGALTNIGKIFLNQGNYKDASDSFAQAYKLAKALDSPNDLGTLLDDLALSALGSGDSNTAESYNQQALAIFKTNQNDSEELRSLLTTATIADTRKDFERARPILDRVIADKETLDTVRLEAQDERARLFASTGLKAKANAEYKDVLDKIGRVRVSIEGIENKLAFAFWEAAFYTKYIEFLGEQNDPRGAFEATELIRARTLEEGPGGNLTHAKVSDIQKFLAKKHEIILAYWLAPEKSFLWIVTPSDCRQFPLPSKQAIDENVRLYQEAVTNGRDTETGNESGEWLFRMLAEPARQLITKNARIVIISDGSLGQLNFETLLAPKPSPHFWIRDVELQAAHSVALLMKPRTDSAPGEKLEIIGDPVEADPDYGRLVYAQKEMGVVAAQFLGPRTIISGPSAVPSAYAASKPGSYDVIHFSTHGSANEASPLESAIILSPEKNGSFKLYAREVINTPLRARIVVISACYGAGKRTYSAEGLVGLAWAFLRAGSRQVIAGLWNVNDEVTPELMHDFYAEWRKSKDTAGALHLAKLKMLNTGRKAFRRPYYWASLQLYTGSQN